MGQVVLGFLWTLVVLLDMQISVTAIKCIVCTTHKVEAHSDALLQRFPDRNDRPLCRNFGDTIELKPFSMDCPAEYTSCEAYAAAPPRHDGNAFRTCSKLAGPGCRLVGPADYVQTFLCPCYTDNCNVYQTTIGSTAPNYIPKLLDGQTDNNKLGTGGSFPSSADGSNVNNNNNNNNNGGDASTSSNAPPPVGQPDNNKADVVSGGASPSANASASPTPTAGTLSVHQALTCSVTSGLAALLTLHMYTEHLCRLLWL